MHKINKFLNRETVSYIIAGVLTTAVDYIIFTAVNEALGAAGLDSTKAAVAASAVSWVCAVIFAYMANKLVVFKNFDFNLPHLIKETAAFFSTRILSGAIALFLMYIMTGPLKLNEYIAKIITSVFNLVFNYAASKLFVFKK